MRKKRLVQGVIIVLLVILAVVLIMIFDIGDPAALIFGEGII